MEFMTAQKNYFTLILIYYLRYHFYGANQQFFSKSEFILKSFYAEVQKNELNLSKKGFNISTPLKAQLFF